MSSGLEEEEEDAAADSFMRRSIRSATDGGTRRMNCSSIAAPIPPGQGGSMRPSPTQASLRRRAESRRGQGLFPLAAFYRLGRNWRVPHASAILADPLVPDDTGWWVRPTDNPFLLSNVTSYVNIFLISHLLQHHLFFHSSDYLYFP